MQHTCAETAAMKMMVVEGSVHDWAGQTADAVASISCLTGNKHNFRTLQEERNFRSQLHS